MPHVKWSTLLAKAAVRRRLLAGWVPWVHRRIGPGSIEEWALIDGETVKTEPITPPEGEVLDDVLSEWAEIQEEQQE